jgi:hypothetical protein
MENGQTNSLKLIRFCGDEYFPIVKANWFIKKANDAVELWFDIETTEGTTVCEDTKSFKATPFWQLVYIAKKLDKNDLKIGFKVKIPNGWDEDRDDTVTNFYYFEHQETDNNLIEILGTDGEKLYVRITGETQDVDYYDGSKPKNKIIVETWFEYGNIIKI